MKRIKKIASLMLALVMVFAMTITAFATETNPTTGNDNKGSITINSSATVSVAGKTFNAYKILDVQSYTPAEGGNAATVVYTVPSEMKSFYATRYGLTGNEGDFDAQVVKKISEESDMFTFAAAALKEAKGENPDAPKIKPYTATADENASSVTISNLPLGYYVVEDEGEATPISALILDTTNPNVTAVIKADKPSVDKKIDGTKDTDDSTTGDVEYNNAAVGDDVPYKVSSKVPDMTGYTKYYFVVNDTLSKGLTFNDDVAIKIGNETLTRIYYNEGKYYSKAVYDEEKKTWNYEEEVEESGEKSKKYIVTETKQDDGTTKVEIVFINFIQYNTHDGDRKDSNGNDIPGDVGKEILITYSATVNEGAVIGVAGNPNKVTLTYSHDPNQKDDGDPENPDKPTPTSPTGTTPEEETRTYVTDIELIKVDPQGNRLTGAEFKIEGTKLNTVLVRTDVYTEDANGTYWKLKDGSYTTDDPNAEGMDQSKYESTNTKYTKGIETTTIEKAENVTYTGTVGADGVLCFEGLSAGTYTITEIKAPNGYNLLKDPITVTIGFTAPVAPSTDCTWNYTGTDVVNDTNTNHVTVTNQTGSELPSTGGTGTTLFYLIGGILVLVAGVLLVTKKRMSAEK